MIQVQKMKAKKETVSFAANFTPTLKAEEGWIRCQHCEGWAHEAYAGVREDEVIICNFCQ